MKGDEMGRGKSRSEVASEFNIDKNSCTASPFPEYCLSRSIFIYLTIHACTYVTEQQRVDRNVMQIYIQRKRKATPLIQERRGERSVYGDACEPQHARYKDQLYLLSRATLHNE